MRHRLFTENEPDDTKVVTIKDPRHRYVMQCLGTAADSEKSRFDHHKRLAVRLRAASAPDADYRPLSKIVMAVIDDLPESRVETRAKYIKDARTGAFTLSKTDTYLFADNIQQRLYKRFEAVKMCIDTIKLDAELSFIPATAHHILSEPRKPVSMLTCEFYTRDQFAMIVVMGLVVDEMSYRSRVESPDILRPLKTLTDEQLHDLNALFQDVIGCFRWHARATQSAELGGRIRSRSVMSARECARVVGVDAVLASAAAKYMPEPESKANAGESVCEPSEHRRCCIM